MSQPKKILFVANVHDFFLMCLIPYIKWLSGQGHEVHVVAGGDDHIPYATCQFNISIQRSPFKWKNIGAYYELKKIIKENNYDLIHCHAPMGGVLARLAARNLRKKKELKVLYTVHGFHFYKGAPFFYWLIYYPVEKYLSRYTDALVTINQEDSENVKRFGFKCKEFRISGIGIDNYKFKPVNSEEKNRIRKESGYAENLFILVYAAEFIPGKNHKFIIDALPFIIKEIPELKVIFAGIGELMEITKSYVNQLDLSEIIDFAGYRNDVEKLMSMSDVGISPSLREGLPMNVSEAMFCGLPVVATRIRGHVDLITDGVNGLLYEEGNREAFITHVLNLYHSLDERKRLGDMAKETVKPFGIEQVIHQMAKIYKQYF